MDYRRRLRHQVLLAGLAFFLAAGPQPRTVARTGHAGRDGLTLPQQSLQPAAGLQ